MYGNTVGGARLGFGEEWGVEFGVSFFGTEEWFDLPVLRCDRSKWKSCCWLDERVTWDSKNGGWVVALSLASFQTCSTRSIRNQNFYLLYFKTAKSRGACWPRWPMRGRWPKRRRALNGFEWFSGLKDPAGWLVPSRIASRLIHYNNPSNLWFIPKIWSIY